MGAFWSAASCEFTSRAADSFLVYFEHEFPIAPGTYRHILEIALAQLAEHKEEDFYAELQKHPHRAGIFAPTYARPIQSALQERTREKEVIKRRLERRCQEASLVERAIEKALTIINGKLGDPRSLRRSGCAFERSGVSASLFGGSRRRKSITGASSISMISARHQGGIARGF
jgi:hypothetical protein